MILYLQDKWKNNRLLGMKDDLPLLHVISVSWFCSLFPSLIRWRCWFVLDSWLHGFLMQWSLCGQRLEGQTPSQYSFLWCQHSLRNQQPCTIRSSTKSLITNFPVAELVVWKQPKRSLWKISGKVSEVGNKSYSLFQNSVGCNPLDCTVSKLQLIT